MLYRVHLKVPLAARRKSLMIQCLAGHHASEFKECHDNNGPTAPNMRPSCFIALGIPMGP